MLSLLSKDKGLYVFCDLWLTYYYPGHVQALKTLPDWFPVEKKVQRREVEGRKRS